jgi:hydroxymethylpyrimidine pyrophosphatase-like HAD family hydrolase
MRYFALASDYDGTLADSGVVRPSTLDALKKFRDSGRQLLLNTGRELPDLMSVFPEYEVFQWIIAENGAVLFETATKAETLLADPPPPQLIESLRRRNIGPLYMGRVIVAMLDEWEEKVREIIHELGLNLQIILNKDALMILPSGVDKASGLKTCLKKIGLSLDNTVGVGDAENDYAFLSICERSVAVSNALPALKAQADLVTAGSCGAGVTELIERILADDLASVPSRRQPA